MEGAESTQARTMASAKSNPRLSIGVPVYNGAAFLRETLESILAQTFGDFELIISDNASTDGTEAIAREFASSDSRVRYHRNERNLGLAKNYNILFSLSSGEYFKWASADDRCLPGYLERCIAVLDHDPEVVLVYPRTRFVDASGNSLDMEDPGWNLMSDLPQERLQYVVRSGHWVNSILGVIRSRALGRTRLLPSYPGGDYCLLAELSLMGKFFEVAEPLYQRRIHPGSSSQLDARVIAEYWKGTGGSVPMSQWSRSLDYFRTIAESDLSPAAKVSVSLSLLHAMYWRRGRLWKEIRIAAGARVGRGLALNGTTNDSDDVNARPRGADPEVQGGDA
jgi:glycosyltransferase involved in cell wall biosynthesis